MDEDVWEFIWMKFHSSGAVSEKKILLEALTCSDNTFLLNRYSDVYVSLGFCAFKAPLVDVYIDSLGVHLI